MIKNVVDFYRSTIGKKIIVALTGIVFIAFVLVHMLGNMQIYLGQDAINQYAYFLHSKPQLVWGSRIFLLLCLILHVVSTIALKKRNLGARGEAYKEKEYIKAGISSRVMMMTGILLLAFIVYHILHLTVGVGNDYKTWFDSEGRLDVYRMMVVSFSCWTVSIVYIVAIFLLAFHLNHGVSSVFQTLGLRTKQSWCYIVLIARAYALLILIGNISIPISILLGIVSLPNS